MKIFLRGFTLIELLVVIAIIGILAGLLFPAVNGAIDGARKAQAKNDVVQIATAVTAYETEYGRLPALTSPIDKSDEVGGNLLNALMGTTTNDNPRRIVFIEVQDAKRNRSGITNNKFVDPWAGPYQIALDGNYDNQLSVTVPRLSGSGTENLTLRKKVAVWNINANTRRLVRSWE